MKPYRVVNEETVELIDGPFAGTLYQYGGVKLEPDNIEDKLTLAFTYQILSGLAPKNEERFHRYIGDILVELIHDGMKTGTLVFKSDTPGDTSAPRDKDNLKPSLLRRIRSKGWPFHSSGIFRRKD